MRRLVTREGIYLFAVSARWGVIIGSVIAYFLKPDGWSFLNTLLVALLVLVIDLITVLISVRKPASIAASISPIEASKIFGLLRWKEKENQSTPENQPAASRGHELGQKPEKVFMTVLSLGIGGVFIYGSGDLCQFL